MPWAACPRARRLRKLLFRYLVDRVLEVRREVNRAGRPDPDPGRNIGRQSPWCADQPNGQVAGDLADVPALWIDFDDAFGADLGHDQLAIGCPRDAFRHLQVLGQYVFSPLLSIFEIRPAKASVTYTSPLAPPTNPTG